MDFEGRECPPLTEVCRQRERRNPSRSQLDQEREIVNDAEPRRVDAPYGPYETTLEQHPDEEGQVNDDKGENPPYTITVAEKQKRASRNQPSENDDQDRGTDWGIARSSGRWRWHRWLGLLPEFLVTSDRLAQVLIVEVEWVVNAVHGIQRKAFSVACAQFFDE